MAKPNPDEMLAGLELDDEGLEAEGEASDSVAAMGDFLDAVKANDAKAADSALRAWLALADSGS